MYTASESIGGEIGHDKAESQLPHQGERDRKGDIRHYRIHAHGQRTHARQRGEYTQDRGASCIHIRTFARIFTYHRTAEGDHDKDGQLAQGVHYASEGGAHAEEQRRDLQIVCAAYGEQYREKRRYAQKRNSLGGWYVFCQCGILPKIIILYDGRRIYLT